MNKLFRFLGVLLLVLTIANIRPAISSAAELPDLQPTQITASTIYIGVDNTVSAVVANNTNITVPDFTVCLVVNGNVVASSASNYVSGNEDPYYWPLSVTFNWAPENAGVYNLKIVIDPEQSVAEVNETNNEISRDVTVIPLTDVKINVRVEGKTSTIWSGEVTFRTSTITDKQGDTHIIDHPTVLGALQGAAEAGNFNYVVSSSYGACKFIESIAGDSNSGAYGWLYKVNWTGSDSAAVDFSLGDGDEVLWHYGGWAAQTLKLSSDKTLLESSDTLSLTVQSYNGSSWLPVENATVHAGSHLYSTDPAGQVSGISLPAGGYTVYAEKETYETFIRSNPLEIVSFIPLELEQGWNFISVPRRLKDGHSTVEALLGEVNTGGHSIFAYNPQASQNWKALGASDTVLPLDGIWVYSLSPVTLYPVFDPDPLQAPPVKNLAAGWNAIGFSDFDSATANSALTSVENQWAYLIGFDAESQSYEVSIVNNTPDSDPHSENRLLETWKGYWLYMTDNGQLAAISN